jgi:predicted double-glycine peptidase
VYPPLVRQAYDYSCGAAALTSCLYYWGVFTGSETELYAQLGTTCQGTSALGIMTVASSFGLDVKYGTRLSLDDLRDYLQQGYTCLLNLQAWGDYTPDTDFSQVWEDGHYVVLANLTLSDVILMDPAIPGQYGILSSDTFQARWHDWSDNGDCQEFHTAILLRGQVIAPLSQPLRLT